VNLKVEGFGMYKVGGGYPDGPPGSVFILALGKSTAGPFIVAIVSLLAEVGTAIFLAINTYATRRPQNPA